VSVKRYRDIEPSDVIDLWKHPRFRQSWRRDECRTLPSVVVSVTRQGMGIVGCVVLPDGKFATLLLVDRWRHPGDRRVHGKTHFERLFPRDSTVGRSCRSDRQMHRE